MAKKKTLSEQVRAEVRRQGLSCYRVAKETGLNEATIGRFMNANKELRSDSLAFVLDYLGLELVRSDELLALRNLAKKHGATK